MDRYSRMVQFLKVLLPLVAILLLSMVFLLSRSIETNVSGPFTEQDLDARVKSQMVTRPRFRGTTRKGEDIQVEAVQASRGSAEGVPTASRLQGRFGLTNGGVITLDSETGMLQPNKGEAVFSGDVVMTTTDGIRVTTDLLNTSLDEIRGETPGPVQAVGPIGRFSAGRMRFGAEKTDGPVHILFTDGVKLVYEPPKTER